MGSLLVVTVILAVAVLAPLFGADSRALDARSGGPPDLLPDPDPPRRPSGHPPDGPSVRSAGTPPEDVHREDVASADVRSGEVAGASMASRLVRLYAGLALYGVSMAFFVQGHLGVMPWDVLHQGLTRWLPVSLGLMTVVVAVVVLLGWIPLRQRPGVGTVSNVIVIGVVVDAALAVLPAPSGLAWRVAFVVTGVVLNAVATAAYIGARLGPGPRDGLMTGIVARTGWPVRRVRTSIEVGVVAVGWLLGGNFGAGTLLYAFAVGPLVQPLLPLLDTAPRTVPAPPEPVRMALSSR